MLTIYLKRMRGCEPDRPLCRLRRADQKSKLANPPTDAQRAFSVTGCRPAGLTPCKRRTQVFPFLSFMASSELKPTVVQVIESPLAKHGSFEDFMIQLARSCSRAGIDLHFIFPTIASQGVRNRIEAEGAQVWTVAGMWNSRATVQEIFATIRR